MGSHLFLVWRPEVRFYFGLLHQEAWASRPPGLLFFLLDAKRVRVMNLEQAAADVLARIDADLKRVQAEEDFQVEAFLRQLRNDLFAPNTDVKQLKRKAGLRDNSVVIRFHSRLGVTPRQYLTRCRLEIASKLLVETNLRIWRIAEWVGYSSLAVFSKAFEREEGIRPSRFRRVRAKGGKISEVERLVNGGRVSCGYLEALLAGDAPEEDASAIIARLQRLYPTACPNLSPS